VSISNFIPTIWAPALLVALRKNLKFAPLTNRDYEGEIANAGATVNITSFGIPAVRSYSRNNNVSWDILADATRALTVDQQDYFAFTVDDVDKRQALPGFVAQATSDAGYALAENADRYIAAALSAGVNASNVIADTTVSVSGANLYGVLVKMRTALSVANIPYPGRWLVLPPLGMEYVLQDARFINAQAAADAGMALHEGAVGRIAGFDVLESVNVPAGSAGVYNLLAGHPMAYTFADQILETEAIRLQNQFGDGIRGLHVYGGKVVRDTALAKCHMTFA